MQNPGKTPSNRFKWEGQNDWMLMHVSNCHLPFTQLLHVPLYMYKLLYSGGVASGETSEEMGLDI